MQYTQTWAWVHDCIVQFFPGVLFDQLSQGNVFEKQTNTCQTLIRVNSLGTVG